VINVYSVLRRVDCKIFAEVSAFSAMVKQFKNTALLDPESEDKTVLRAAGNFLPLITLFRPCSPEPTT